MFSGNLAIFIVLYGFMGSVVAKKIWMPNTNYENPKNWDSGRVPCYKDSVRIPEDVSTVFIQQSATLEALLLPMNGEISLGDSAVLTFGGQADPQVAKDTDSCQTGNAVQYIRTKPASWFDPANWCESKSSECVATSDVEIVPLDTERVPCHQDEVVFPGNSNFWVDVGSQSDIVMGKLFMASKEYTTASDFNGFLGSDLGKQQFVTSGTKKKSRFIINNDPCTSKAGCYCGNDKQAKDTICTFVSNKCPTSNCSNPFQPVGGCCKLCGSLLTLEDSTQFEVRRLKSMLTHNFLKKQANVKAMVSKMPGNAIQLVFTDDNNGNDAVAIADTFIADVEQDIQGTGNKYGLTAVNLKQTSSEGKHPVEPPVTPAKHTGNKGGGEDLSGGGLAGVIIACFVALCLIIALVGIVVYRRRPMQFKLFAKNAKKKKVPTATLR